MSPASLASLNLTMSTLEDKLWELIMTLFTLVRPGNVSPACVCTVMALSEHLRCSFHLNLPLDNILRYRSTVDQYVCSSVEAVFVPLDTSTCPPRGAAYITELSSAPTSANSQFSSNKSCPGKLRDVVATHFQLNYSSTGEASLPTLLTCKINQSLQGSILRAFF